MNKENISVLFCNYIEHFAELNNPEHEEYFKWNAIGQVQECWDLEAEAFGQMLRKAFKESYTLLDNRIVQPVNGIISLTEKDEETVREAFRHLLEEDQGDIDARQMRIVAFVDECNKLMEKHFPGKWKYSQDIRSAVCYLAMIKPSENYLFKSTPAHHFAEYMEYPNDIGAGQTFKLKHYYDMCDRLIELAGECPELLAADAGRPSTWKDPSRHVLAYDLIYCMDAYELTSGMIHPPVKSKSSSAKQRAYRAEMATMVQKEIDGLQDQVDELNQQIDELSPASFEGKSIRTKAFGMVTIKQQRGRYLLFEAGGSEKQFVLPDCIANGFLIPEETEVIERYKQEQKLQKQVNLLEREQKVKFLEMQKFLD